MPNKSQINSRKKLYDDAVANDMFINKTPSFGEFSRRLDNVVGYADKVYNNYMKHDVQGLGSSTDFKKKIGVVSNHPTHPTQPATWMKEITPQSPVPSMIARPADYAEAGTFAKQLEDNDENSYAGIRHRQGLPKGKYTEADVQGVNDRMEQRELDRQKTNAERLKKNADAGMSSVNEPMYTSFGTGIPGMNLTMEVPSSKMKKQMDKKVASVAALGQISKAQEALTEDRKMKAEDKSADGIVEKTWNAAKRGARGLAHRAKNFSAYDSGITDMVNNTALLDAATAYDNGTATKEQQSLLDAAAFNTKVQNEHGDALGGMYGAGGVAVDSAVFGLQFLAGGELGDIGKAASSGVGKYVASKLGKDLAKKFMGKAITGASKATARFAGDQVSGVAMNSLFGIPTTMADASDRMTGTIMPAKDENGHVVYSGQREGAETNTAKALGKAFVNNTLQYSSELSSDYFKPIGKFIGGTISKGLEKVGLGSVSNWLTGLSNKQLVKSYQNFADKTKWGGTFEQYGEEVVYNVENAGTVGDMNFNSPDDPNSVFNKKTNIDTFLGVALAGGFMSAVKTGTYLRNKYKAGKALGDADTKAATVLGADTWNNTKASIDDADDKNIVSVLTEAAKGKTPEQARSIMRYAGMMYAYRGANLAQMKDAAEGNGKSAIEQGYDKGRSLTDGNDMVDANNDYKHKRDAAATALGSDENIDAVFANGATSEAMLDRMKNSGAYTDEQIKAAEDYANAKSVYDGMIDNVRDKIDSSIKESEAKIESRVNKADDMIHPATMIDNDRKVYVISGNVTLSEDGDIDDFNSDDYVIVADAETGEMEMTPPSFLKSADAPINAEQEKQEAADNITDTMAQEASDKIDGVLPFSQGDIYLVDGADGNQHSLQVVSDTGDGNVQVVSDGVDNVVLPKETIQQLVDANNLARLQQKQMAGEADNGNGVGETRNAGEAGAEASRPAYNLNDEIAIHDENGNIVRGSVTANENEDGQIEVYSESPINGKKVNVFTREELDAINANNEEIAQETPVSVQNPQEIVQEEPVLAQNEKNEVNLPQSEKQPMPMVGEGENAEPDFYNVEPKRARDYIYEETGLSRDEANGFVKANEEASAKALDKAKKSQPKIGTSISKYNKEKSEWQKKVDEAQRVADYWKNVKDAQHSVYNQEGSVRQQKQAEATEKAIEEDKQFRAEQAKKAEEQTLIGTNNVSPAIRDKWNNAPKIDGASDEIVLPNGEKVAGHYILAESGAASPSHNATAEFAKTEGFPIDDNDQSVNDRDYERDQDAQTITRGMAGNYDSRAMQTPVVVSNDGVVLSGNGRTMAGELAARDNTDGAYIEHLKKYPQKYGFTEEQVAGMQHPRVLFVPDDAMPYTSDTFSKFNQQEMKGQSKKEHAVKMGKIVDDATYNRIIRSINRYDTLGEFYADTAASTGSIKDLQNAGAISAAQMTEMFDGDTISSQAKELLENVLIGKAFESNPDAVRQITAYKSMRQSIIMALGEISNNQLLGDDYNLRNEIAAAIDLVYNARNSGIKAGEPASSYARQGNLFQLDDGATVADYTNATVMILADIINDNRVTLLKKYLSLYNERAKDASIGQTDMFTGTVDNKQDIIQSVNNFFQNATKSKQQEAIDKAVEQRKTESVQQNGDSNSVDERPEETGKSATAEAIAEAEQSTETNPTDAQKEAGNYKKGHVQIGSFDITVENPKGSERSGKDANGNPWSITMQNTYGYIRGTEGVDGDHIDVFIADDFDAWNGRKIFVVDQYNEDGTFDEHKVMLGFNDIDEAESAYYANYSPNWKEKHPANKVTAVNAEDFEKWIDSSKRKTKAFADYANVKTDHIPDAKKMVDKKDVVVSKTETTTSSKKNEEEPKPIGKGSFGNIYDQFKGKAKEAIAFLMNKKDGEAIAALHHNEVGDIDLVWGKEGTAKSDGFGLAKLVKFHPEVLDNLQGILDDMHVTQRSENRVQLESDKYQAAIRLTWDNEKKTWLLTMFEKKNSVLDNTTDTVETQKGNGNDTATPENAVSSDGKDTKFSDKEEIKSKKNTNATKMVEDNKQENHEENDDVLKNNVNFAAKSKENGNNKETDQGAPVLQRDSQKELGSDHEVTGGTRPEVDQLERRVAQAQRDARSIEEIENEARTFAKANGLWIPYSDIMEHTPFQSGNESDNYIDEEHGLLYKVNNLMHSKGSLADNFVRVKLYNELFPETKLTFVGLTSISEKGAVYPVYTQEFVNDATFASEDEIRQYMHERGFEPTRKEAAYSNGEYTVSDLRPRNVLKDANGRICVIDADVEEKETKDRYRTNDGDIRYRNSEELDKEYPTWLSGQTTDTGQHTTQITSTVNTYKKIGTWMDKNDMKGAKVLDASSGLGKGTEVLRDMGFDVEDVEPYPSDNRDKPTYRKYNDVKGKYDVVISNAVLNVIPDDWRADVLKSMADKVKFGGKLIINVRDAKEIERQKQKIELDSPSEILVTDKAGNIRAYQKGFTQKELADLVKDELGDGWTVETATPKNIGISGRAVVVTRKTETPLQYRSVKTFADGENLLVHYDGESYSVDGVSSTFKDKDALLDAFRNKYENYVATLSNSGKDITVEPWSKYLKGTVGNVGIGEHVDRKTRHAQAAVENLANKLHLDKIEVITDTSNLTGKKKSSKGWYDTETGKIAIVLPNHTSVSDVIRTLLHEGVAHHGLREMFGEHFDTFLYNVYANADSQIRKKIVDMAAKNGWNFSKATEEYMASLAEDTDFEHEGTWWGKIKDFFIKMLAEAGIKLEIQLSDNELRYVLWRSYQNLVHPNERSLFNKTEDIAMQYNLKVGEYTADDVGMVGKVSDEGEDSNDNILFRDGNPTDTATTLYEDGVTDTFAHRISEAWYDYLRSVQMLQESIEKQLGRKLHDYENVYLHAMHKTSVDMQEWNRMMQDYVKPLSKALSDVIKNGKREFHDGELTQRDVEDYLNCVHGLERNDVFAMRDAKNKHDDAVTKANIEFAKGNIDEAAHDKLVADADSKLMDDYNKNRKRDYSGLTELFDTDGTGHYTNAELEDIARAYIRDMETAVPKSELDNLWDKIGKMNGFSLKKSYESGLISKQAYEETTKMFTHYVPLRGFDGETAEDVYDYVTAGTPPMEKVMKHAKGRTSKATDIIATMMNMGHSAIVSGNKNLVKQKLLNLALNGNTTLLSVSRQWYEKDGEDGWKPVEEPEIKDGMTPEEVRATIEEFEERMKQREANGDVRRMKKGVKLNVRIDSNRKQNEHGVNVKRNGEEYVVWVNASPKAAQAINGLLNPEANRNAVTNGLAWMNRFISKNVTALNPEFLLRNLKRDVISSNIVGFSKYGAKYTAMFDRFVKDNLSLMDVKGARAGHYHGIYDLYHRYNKGTLDMNIKKERYFAEFMKHGGETGYSQMWSIDDYKKQIRHTLNSSTGIGKTRSVGDAILDGIEFANKGIENVCRFAAYMASRENGMSVLESIADAKEASVNFNRKGSGAMGNDLARALFMFLNPSIQGFVQHTKLIKQYPKRMLPICGAAIGIGFLMPILAATVSGGGDGDDDDYFNINPFVRRNNVIINVGDNKYIKIDLPQEMRTWYGLGEIAYSAMTGHMGHENTAVAMMAQLTRLCIYVKA